MKYKNTEYVMDLPPEVIQAFTHASACERAVKKIVKEIVHEAELADMANNTIWELLKEEYKLDFAVWHYEVEDGIKLVRRTRDDVKVEEYMDSFDNKIKMKKTLKERMFGNKKKCDK